MLGGFIPLESLVVAFVTIRILVGWRSTAQYSSSTWCLRNLTFMKNKFAVSQYCDLVVRSGCTFWCRSLVLPSGSALRRLILLVQLSEDTFCPWGRKSPLRSQSVSGIVIWLASSRTIWSRYLIHSQIPRAINCPQDRAFVQADVAWAQSRALLQACESNPRTVPRLLPTTGNSLTLRSIPGAVFLRRVAIWSNVLVT